MQKRILRIITLFSILLSPLNIVSAYEYVDSSRSNVINSMINDIFNKKRQYDQIFGDMIDEETTVYSKTNTLYWWPIGSMETTKSGNITYAMGNPEYVNISSGFQGRNDPATGKWVNHTGLDIPSGGRVNEVNVIAANSGIVVYPNKNSKIDCPTGRQSYSPCNGYGNYVVIQHSDGNYTLYGHLYQNSILVRSGDKVEQGQVIAKVGSSGYSTGAHVHFEVRIGQNAQNATVDPLEYVNTSNPRPVSTSDDNELIKMLKHLEGAKTSGDSYVVYQPKNDDPTVGVGVNLKYTADMFKKYNYDVSNVKAGDTLPKDVVDNVMMDIIEDKKSSIRSIISENNITLKEYQIDALALMYYQAGNINGFVTNYKKYGCTEEFYKKWFYNKGLNKEYIEGIHNRRNKEWLLFSTGKYTY